jgi:hypothetical protein
LRESERGLILRSSYVEIARVVIRCEDCKPEVVYIGLQTNTIIVNFLPGFDAPGVGDVAPNWVNK